MCIQVEGRYFEQLSSLFLCNFFFYSKTLSCELVLFAFINLILIALVLNFGHNFVYGILNLKLPKQYILSDGYRVAGHFA